MGHEGIGKDRLRFGEEIFQLDSVAGGVAGTKVGKD